MKKKIFASKVLALAIGVSIVASMAGCGKSSKSATDYVKLGDYKNLEVDLTVKTVTDEEVQSQIDSDLKDNSTNEEVTDRTAVQDGDIVNLNMTATVDGEDFENGDVDDYDYTLGSNEYGEEFNTGLIGKNKGEQFELTATLPEDYENDTYAGKSAVFKITINSIKKEVVPEFNDEFVKKVSDDCKTTDEYREYVRKDLQKTEDDNNLTSAKDDLLSSAVANAKVSGCPDKLYNLYYNQMTNDYTNYASQWGMDFDSFITNYMGMDLDAFKDFVLDQVYEMEVVKTIATKEKIKVTSDEYKKNVKKIVEDNGWDSVDELEDSYSKEYLENSMLKDEVEDFLYDNAKVTKVDAAEEETESLEENTETDAATDESESAAE